MIELSIYFINFASCKTVYQNPPVTGAAPRPDSLRTGQNRQNMANRNEVEEQNAIDKLNTNLSEASEKIAQNKKVIFWTVGDRKSVV